MKATAIATDPFCRGSPILGVQRVTGWQQRGKRPVSCQVGLRRMLVAASLLLWWALSLGAAAVMRDRFGGPWAVERSRAGRSVGLAAASGACRVRAATGTDTAGSLRIPSACCGTSAIKPTRGLVSLDGIVPLASSLDHAGP